MPKDFKVSHEQLIWEIAVSQHDRLITLLATLKNEVVRGMTQERITALEKRYPMLRGKK